jgi:hypothetical protein
MDNEHAIATDLDQTMARILALWPAGAPPDHAAESALQAAAQWLQDFAQRHRQALDFRAFPLPTGAGEALCSYELFQDPATGLCLSLNALNAGIDSAIHDHGSWAIIAAVHGRECNRIYQHQHLPDGTPDLDAPPRLEREVWVQSGQANGNGHDRPTLILAPTVFHSIHTTEPTLQLHLYGRALDTLPQRRAYGLNSGRLTLLG